MIKLNHRHKVCMVYFLIDAYRPVFFAIGEFDLSLWLAGCFRLYTSFNIRICEAVNAGSQLCDCLLFLVTGQNARPALLHLHWISIPQQMSLLFGDGLQNQAGHLPAPGADGKCGAPDGSVPLFCAYPKLCFFTMTTTPVQGILVRHSKIIDA
jgi:hypothetical protein